MMDLNDNHSGSEDTNGDGDGVWSPDIEQCFREALLLFPPCGRRKHILQEEGGGKMYGRNELIARHIMMRTGKSRTRKQVSSHIQVLARRKAKAEAASTSSGNLSLSPSSTHISQSRPQSSIGSAVPQLDVWTDRPIATKRIRLVEFSAFIEYRGEQPYSSSRPTQAVNSQPMDGIFNVRVEPDQNQGMNYLGAPLSSSGGRLMRHAYVAIDYSLPINRQTNKIERINISQVQDKFPEITGAEGLYQRGPHDAFFMVKFWVDLTHDYEFNFDDQNSFFGFSSRFETSEPLKDITCSTKLCSYGLQVVEKVEKIYGAYNNANGRYSYDIDRSPMCEFMIQFIKKLRRLPRSTQMNSVLENFTVLQVITNESASEILLCLAYVFEIPLQETDAAGPQSQVYQLTKD